MAVASAMLTRMHTSVGYCRPTPLFECRADPSSGSAKFEQSDFKRKSKTAKDFARGMACTGASGLMILRFPPNFDRQLSIKARRNCSNIGVAQIGAASVTNIPLAEDTPSVTCNTNSVQIDSALLPPALAKGSGTLAVHSGEKSGRAIVTDAIATPIVQTSTYTFKDTAELIAFQEGRHVSYEYGRYGNPTTQVAEEKISALEGAETTLLLASGMCATTTMMLALVPAGGHIITTTDCYRRTRQFIQTVLPNSRSALALISICILLCLSGLGDCRAPFQREEVVGEKEQSVNLLLPSEKEEFNEIARETLPLERSRLRGNDGIFQGERSRGFGFGRPGRHHGKFNRRGQRKGEHIPFPLELPDVQAESRDFHPRMDRPLPEKSDFGPGFSKGEWRQQRHGHPEEEQREKENNHMPFPARGVWLEFLFHLFPGHADPAEFHPKVYEFWPLPRETEFVYGFPNGGEARQHRDERGERKRDNEHMPFPEEQTESFPHAFPVEESTEFRSRVEEFLPLPRERDFDHDFPSREGRQPRHGHGHGHEEEEKENEQFPFPTKGERTESFTYTFPVQAESTEFHSKVEEFLPLPRERDFEHDFPGREGKQPGHRHAHGEEEQRM